MKKSLLVLIGVVTLAVSGCTVPEGSAPAAAPVAEEGTGSADDSVKVRIGTMNLVNGDLIAQYEKYYENELNADVEILNFDSGKDVNTALAANAIDITELGSSPCALGLSNGIDMQVIWCGDIIGSAETLVAKQSTGASEVTDLKGLKIATPFASTAHYSLLNALELAGVAESDLELFDMQPDDIYAAWQRGDIDAAYVWYPVLGKLMEDGVSITDSAQLAEKNIITADLNVARTEFAEQHPEIVAAYIKAQMKANDMILDEPEKAAADIAAVLEIPEEDAAEQITEFKYMKADEQLTFLEENLADSLKSAADFLVTQDSIKEAPELSFFRERVNTSYLREAMK